MFDPRWRERAIAGLSRPFDLVVLGAGITGCGIFLDAAQRGLRVLLVEREDIASGTSSRSSKLVHGGLRYLKRLQLGTTRTSCRERDRLLALSPHLVEPIRFVYPFYRGARPASWRIELGLWVFDRLTGSADKHARLSESELLGLAPDVKRDGLERVLAYSDARTDDARLTLAVASTGFGQGGLVLTRATVEEGIDDADGRLRGVAVRDLLTGAVHRVEAGLVINAAGVWVDRVRRLLGREGKRLRPSRGSHLLFPAERLPLRAAVTVPSPDDGRPVVFVPHPEGVLAGTTDIFHDGELDDPRPTRHEIDYLLRAVAATFPQNPPSLDDAVGCFAGLRPILAQRAVDPSAASREEGIWEERGLLSVAGGKLTTWRATAEKAVDVALTHLPPGRARRARPCATRETALAGAAPIDLADRLQAAHGLEAPVAAALVRRLGGLAETACGMARGREELVPLAAGLDLCSAELRAHLRCGAVVHLSDLLLRRVRLGMWRPALLGEILPRLQGTVGAEMGWSGVRWDEECGRLARDGEGWTLSGIRPRGP